MSNAKRIHNGRGTPDASAHHERRPYWTRAHYDWRFWVALLLMFGAMGIYVMSDDLAFLPR